MLIRGNAFSLPFKKEVMHSIVTSPPYWNLRQYLGLHDDQLGLESTPELYIQHSIEVLEECWRVLRPDGTIWWNLGDTYASHQNGPQGWYRRGDSSLVGGGRISQAMAARVKKVGIKDKDMALIPFRFALAVQGYAVISSSELLQCAEWLEEAVLKRDWEMVGVVAALLRGRSLLAHLDGRWVRSAIIWWKPNVLPDSALDRPARCYEFIFLLAKSKHYYFDMEAVREKYEKSLDRWGGERKKVTDRLLPNSPHPENHRDRKMRPNDDGRHIRNVWHFPADACDETLYDFQSADFQAGGIPYIASPNCPRHAHLAKPDARRKQEAELRGANALADNVCECDVSLDSHFAVFPDELPLRCIKAGSPEKVCEICGAGWVRLTAKDKAIDEGGNRRKHAQVKIRQGKSGALATGVWHTKKTLGWEPTCKCQQEGKGKAVILDIFSGTGTTVAAAYRSGRIGIGPELSGRYMKMAQKRTTGILAQGGLF